MVLLNMVKYLCKLFQVWEKRTNNYRRNNADKVTRPRKKGIINIRGAGEGYNRTTTLMYVTTSI